MGKYAPCAGKSVFMQNSMWPDGRALSEDAETTPGERPLRVEFVVWSQQLPWCQSLRCTVLKPENTPLHALSAELCLTRGGRTVCIQVVASNNCGGLGPGQNRPGHTRLCLYCI